MKIAILHSGDLNNVSPGGVSQYIEKIIKYNKDNEITLYGVVEENSEYLIGNEYIREVEGSKFRFIPIQTNKRKPLSIYYFFNILKLSRELDNYDIIYVQRMEYALPFTFSKNKNKLIMAVHGSGKYSYIFWGKLVGTIYNWLERLAIRNCKKVIILLKREEFGLPYYITKYSKFKDKFRYGKVPIDTGVFKAVNKKSVREKHNFNEKDNILIYFGRLDNNPKRVLLIPEIVKKVSEEVDNIKCIIIGDGEDKEILKKKCVDLCVKNRIIFYDKLNHGDKLMELVNCADLSMILSTFEGICMSALESLACSVPVIATDVGDVNEYIYDKYNGIIVSNSDDEMVIRSFSKEIIDYFKKNKEVNRDDIYMKYSGEVAMKELDDIFYEVKNIEK